MRHLITLRELFRMTREQKLPAGEFYYLEKGVPWSLERRGMFIDWNSEDSDAGLPALAIELGLEESIDADTIEGVVAWSTKLGGKPSDDAALDVFRYYCRFDAYPDRVGAPDPPSREATLLRLDRAFYDILGPEDSGKKCRNDGCKRGTIATSVFCRPHHFENVKRRTCPFSD